MFEDFFRSTSQHSKNGFDSKLHKLEKLYFEDNLANSKEGPDKKKQKKNIRKPKNEQANIRGVINGNEQNRESNIIEIEHIESQRPTNNEEQEVERYREQEPKETFDKIHTRLNRNSLVYKHFSVKKQGYEILPNVESKVKYRQSNGNPYTYTLQYNFSEMVGFKEVLKPSRDSTFFKTHMKIMSNLLYVTIMKKNFNASYHVYCKIMKLYLRKFTTSSVEENTILKETNFSINFNKIWSIGLYILRNYQNCELNKFIHSELELSEFELVSIYRNEKCDLYTCLNEALMNKSTGTESSFSRYNLYLIQQFSAEIDNKYTQFWKWLITFKTSVRYNASSKEETKNLSLTIISSFLWFNLNEIDVTEKMISVLRSNYIIYELEATKTEDFHNAQPIISLNDIKNGYNALKSKFRKLRQAIDSYLLEAFFTSNQILNYIKLLTILLQLKFEIFNYLYDIDMEKQKLNMYVKSSTNSWSQKTIDELFHQFVNIYDGIAKDKLFQADFPGLHKKFEKLKSEFLRSQDEQ